MQLQKASYQKYLFSLAILSLVACESESNDQPNVARADQAVKADQQTTPTTDQVIVDPSDAQLADQEILIEDQSVNAMDATPIVEISLYRCTYKNPFSQTQECKSYTGSSWTVEDIANDCANSSYNQVGTLHIDGSCGFGVEDSLGSCTVGDMAQKGYQLQFQGERVSLCAMTKTACETFLSGSFSPSAICENQTDTPGPSLGGTFIPPTLECKAPLEGESAGMSENGEVCTYSMISACTEPGRDFANYGSCETVLTQRPYYAVNPGVETPADDPRLTDPAFQTELNWVTGEIKACACVCCHSQSAPNGAAIFDVDQRTGIWTDAFSDEGLAMMAGLIPSEVFGAYPPEQNHGFDRSATGAPTTDVTRMQNFFKNEYLRRGKTLEEAQNMPEFGGPLVAQRDYVPTTCNENQGFVNQKLVWTGGSARYLYVLEAGAKNPGVPPNLDLPMGTVWKLDILPNGQPIESGVTFGQIPNTAIQQFPREGTPATLVSGNQYYLYVLRDVAVPITRCLFTMP
jgi:hypothetical protein